MGKKWQIGKERVNIEGNIINGRKKMKSMKESKGGGGREARMVDIGSD